MKAIAEQIPGRGESSMKSILSTVYSKFIFIICFVVFLSACSFKSFYNNLDYLIPSYIEGLVSLDDMLEERVEQRTQLLINWHRNTQLTQYADLLRSFQQSFGPKLTEERVSQHITAMESLWPPLGEKLNQEMAVLLPLLNDDQLDELFDSLNEKNEDFYDEYVDLDKAELYEVYNDRLFENYENWLGDLTEQQETDIEKTSHMFHSSAHLRLKLRKNWQRNIREILVSDDAAESESVQGKSENDKSVNSKSERLRVFFKKFNTERVAALADTGNANKRLITSLTVKLVHAATADQKAYFMNKTDDYIRIFTELAENR